MNRKITNEEVFNEIIHFYNLKNAKGEKYAITPSTGFLAGMFKTSIETIRLHLTALEKKGLIKKIYAKMNAVNYNLVKYEYEEGDN